MGEEVKDAESDARSEMMLPRGTFVTAQVRLDAMHHVLRTSLVLERTVVRLERTEVRLAVGA